MKLHQSTTRRSLGVAWILTTSVVFLAQAGGFETATAGVLRSGSRTAPERANFTRRADPLLDELSAAHDLAASGDLASAEVILRNLQDSPFPWHSWAATSGLLAAYRMNGQTVAAFDLSARVAKERPHLRDLMQVWDGDTAVLAKSLVAARGFYDQAAESSSPGIVDLAYRQLARLALLEKDPRRAATAKRASMQRLAGQVDPEWPLAEALAYEAMATGLLPVKPLPALLHGQEGTLVDPCVIRSRELDTEAGEEMILAGLLGLRFVLSAEDQTWLSRARTLLTSSGADFHPATDACVPSTPADGFRPPVASLSSTLDYLEKVGTGHHSGIDLEVGTEGREDPKTFHAVARGCVVDAFPKALGVAAIEHYSAPEMVVSQYGNAEAVYYSVGAAISKGAVLGRSHDANSGSALHHELRESDHPYRGIADYLSPASVEAVSDHYQDPLPFYRAYSANSAMQWADEGAFARSGDWTYVRSVGNRNDLRWAPTTPVGREAKVARLAFEVSGAGRHELWVFVPDIPGRSTKAPYRILDANGERTLLASVLDQSLHQDAWAALGTLSLSAEGQYILELAADTGESDNRVVLDDVLLVRR